jgi:hypothetical protein
MFKLQEYEEIRRIEPLGVIYNIHILFFLLLLDKTVIIKVPFIG